MPRASLLLTLLVVSSSLAALAPPVGAASLVVETGKLPEPIVGASAAFVGGSAYIFGGRLQGGAYSDDIVKWDPATRTATVVASLPGSLGASGGGRYSGTAVAHGGKIYYFGGAQLVQADINGDRKDESVPRASRDVILFDPATNRAELLDDKLPIGAWGMAAVASGDRIFLFGGFMFDITDLPNTGRHDWVLRFDVTENEASAANPSTRFTELQTKLPFAVQDAAAAVVGQRVLIMGGLGDHEASTNPCPTYTYYNSTSQRDETAQVQVCVSKRIVSFDPLAENVLGVAGDLPYRAQFVSGASVGGKAYVSGGYLTEGSASSSIVEIAMDRVGSPQTRVLVPSLPRGTFGQAVASDGSTIFLAGGRWGRDSELTNEVLRLDPRATAPWAPRGASVTEVSGGVRLTWEAPSYNGDSAVTGYRIYRAAADGVEERLTETTALSFDDTTLRPGNEYTWRITAVNAAGESVASARVTRSSGIAVPGIVSTFSAFPGDGYVELTWTAPTDVGGSNLTGYRVLRNDDIIASLPPDTTRYTDQSAVNGETYVYRVRATNAKGDGALSAGERATPAAYPPAPPNLNAEPIAQGDDTVVRLTWAAAESGERYTIYRSVRPGILGTPIVNVSSTSYTDSVVERGQTYYYSVQASNDVGGGPPTPQASVSLVRKPGPPTEVFAFGQEGEIRVSWAPPADTGDAPEGLLRYYVSRSSGGASSIVKTDIETTLFVDRFVSPNVTYTYTVTTLNPQPSDPSAPASAAARAITNKVPVAILAANPPVADPGDPVEIDASNSADLDGSIRSYHFDFGDGTDPVTTDRPTVSHQYVNNGTYNATVIVVDNRGEQALAYAQVIVGEIVSEGTPEGGGPMVPPSREAQPGSETPAIPGPGALAALLALAVAVGLARRRA